MRRCWPSSGRPAGTLRGGEADPLPCHAHRTRADGQIAAHRSGHAEAQRALRAGGDAAADSPQLGVAVQVLPGGGLGKALVQQPLGLEVKPLDLGGGGVEPGRQITGPAGHVPAGLPEDGQHLLIDFVQCFFREGARFPTTEDVTLPAGALYADVHAMALEPGKQGNVAAGAVTIMAAMPVGIKACTNPEAFSGGDDEEDDSSLRRRLLDSYLRLPNGANAAYYDQTAVGLANR